MTNKEYLKSLFEFVNANDYKTTDYITDIIAKVENGEEYSIVSTQSTEVRPEKINASYYITASNDDEGGIAIGDIEFTDKDYELLMSSSFNNQVFLSNVRMLPYTAILQFVKGSYDIELAIDAVGRALGVIFNNPSEVWRYVKTQLFKKDINDKIFYSDNTVAVYYDPIEDKTYIPYDFVVRVLEALNTGKFLNTRISDKNATEDYTVVAKIPLVEMLNQNAKQGGRKYGLYVTDRVYNGAIVDSTFVNDLNVRIAEKFNELNSQYGFNSENYIYYCTELSFMKSGYEMDYYASAVIYSIDADSFKQYDTSWSNPFPQLMGSSLNPTNGFVFSNADGSNIRRLTNSYIRIELVKVKIDGQNHWRVGDKYFIDHAGSTPIVKEDEETFTWKYNINIYANTIFNIASLPKSSQLGDSTVIFDTTDAMFNIWLESQKTITFYDKVLGLGSAVSILPLQLSVSDSQTGAQSGDSEDDRGVGGNEGSIDDGTTIPPGNADSDDGTTGSGVDSIAVPGFVNAYYCTDANLVELSTWFYETDWNSLGNLILDANPLENIIAIKKVPFQPETDALKNIKVGTLTSDELAPTIIDRLTKINCGKITVKPYFNDLRDYFPYTQCSIYLPFVGVINLNINDIMNSTVEVEYSVDVLTGEGIASIIVERNSMRAVLYTANCNLAIDVPLTSSNAARMMTKAAVAAVAAVGVGAVVGVGGAASSLAGSALSSPARMITSADAIDAVSVGVENGVQATSDTLSKVGTSNITTMNRSGEMSGITGWMGVMTPYLIINRAVKSEPYGYEEIEGVASNHTVKLNNCKGITRVKSIHLENMGYATAEEIAEIEESLKRGVIF